MKESSIGDPSLEVTITTAPREDVDVGSRLWVKARCRHGEAVFVQVQNAEQTESGTAEERNDVVLEASFDNVRAHREGARCELEVRLVSYGGEAIPVGTGCWDGSSTTTMPCDPPVQATRPPGSSTEVEVTDARAEFVSPSLISMEYVLRAREKTDDTRQLEVGVACDHDGKEYVDRGNYTWQWGPFTAEPGESLIEAGVVQLAVSPQTEPEACDLTLGLRNESTQVRDVLHRGCMRGGKLDAGTCDGSTPPTPGAPQFVNAATVEFHLTEVRLEPSRGEPGLRLVSVVDAKVAQTVRDDERLEVRADCKRGGKTLHDFALLGSPSLAAPGQWVREEQPLFSDSPLDKEPQRCQLDIVNNTRDDEVLATYCWRGGKLVPVAC